MKIKARKLIQFGESKGFIIPVNYTEERMEGGLILGKEYDLEITEEKK